MSNVAICTSKTKEQKRNEIQCGFQKKNPKKSAYLFAYFSIVSKTVHENKCGQKAKHKMIKPKC